MQKQRLDLLLSEKGLVESRSQAQGLIMAGQVRVDGQVEIKPAAKVNPGAAIVIDHGPRFVSRGGEKLEGAMQAFSWDVAGQVCADVGASTGGFSDCLLQHAATRVYAIDVGYGILHWKLRNDPRVVVMERTNARFVEKLPEAVTRVTIDASFISLKILLPVIRAWFSQEGGEAVALVKPQFEAGRAEVSRGEGVIQDPQIHRQVLTEVLSKAQEMGYGVRGLVESPLRGPKGNLEFLAWLAYPADQPSMDPGHDPAPDISTLIASVLTAK
jgi:23S rRNA (cytidine1920-2'-O)/16S rRNA (cytidine1409-2'-O)-methyltransferase